MRIDYPESHPLHRNDIRLDAPQAQSHLVPLSLLPRSGRGFVGLRHFCRNTEMEGDHLLELATLRKPEMDKIRKGHFRSDLQIWATEQRGPVGGGGCCRPLPARPLGLSNVAPSY